MCGPVGLRQAAAAAHAERAEAAATSESKAAAEREAALTATIHQLQTALAAADATAAAKLDSMQEEMRHMEQRLREAEAAREEAADSSVAASVPLLRQVWSRIVVPLSTVFVKTRTNSGGGTHASVYTTRAFLLPEVRQADPVGRPLRLYSGC